MSSSVLLMCNCSYKLQRKNLGIVSSLVAIFLRAVKESIDLCASHG